MSPEKASVMPAPFADESVKKTHKLTLLSISENKYSPIFSPLRVIISQAGRSLFTADTRAAAESFLNVMTGLSEKQVEKLNTWVIDINLILDKPIREEVFSDLVDNLIAPISAMTAGKNWLEMNNGAAVTGYDESDF